MTTTPTPAEIEGNQMNNKDRLTAEMNAKLASSSVSPAEIEAFQKGLKLGLVPDGWHPFTSEKPLWKCGFDAQGRYEDNPTALDIQAMEGLAGRELRKDAPHWIEWYRHIDTQILGWNLCDEGGWVCELPGTESEHLPALVDAVRRMRG